MCRGAITNGLVEHTQAPITEIESFSRRRSEAFAQAYANNECIAVLAIDTGSGLDIKDDHPLFEQELACCQAVADKLLEALDAGECARACMSPVTFELLVPRATAWQAGRRARQLEQHLRKTLDDAGVRTPAPVRVRTVIANARQAVCDASVRFDGESPDPLTSIGTSLYSETRSARMDPQDRSDNSFAV
jgi:hypothetical protein